MSGTAPGATALEAARTASEGHGRTARRHERRGLPAGAAGRSGLGSANADPDPGRAGDAGSGGAAVIPLAPRGARPAPPAPATRPASSGTAAPLTADPSPPAPTTRTLEVSR